MTPRCYMYRLLSHLFAKELTVENIESIRSGHAAELMDALKKTAAYAPVICHLKSYFDQMTEAEQAALDLAESYAWLFHGLGGPPDAPLTASAYVGQNGDTFQQSEMAFHDLMHQYGISYVRDGKEPCDHLSVILEFISWLEEKSAASGETHHWRDAQERVIDDYLLNWLPEFAARCKKTDPSGFYASLAKDTLDVVTEDSRQFMSSVHL